MLTIEENILLKNHSTFKIGGPAKYFCVVCSLAELKEAVFWAKNKKQPLFVLGGGSNVLFSDDGFEGLVVKVMSEKLAIDKEVGDKIFVECGAGELLARLVKFTLENSLTGLEWAAGIPGTVGGAIRGNAGAFGGEISNNLEKVTVFDLDSFQEKECGQKEGNFSYRNSLFKQKKNLLIWSAIFSFLKGDQEKINQKIQEVTQQRLAKQPLLGKFPSSGSIFKNPIVPQPVIKLFEEDKETQVLNGQVPAGWLIERCGLKGKKIGGAMISDKQANFIGNLGQASASDVLMLISLIKQKVRNQFGVQLEEEIEIIL